jgi:succinate-semialdehyde dehydrogenase/glutarate-semialdehyde dehydrogenase
LLVHESIAEPFLKRLVQKTEALRQGPSTGPGQNDLGAITYEKQKAVYKKQLAEARSAGVSTLTGGEFSSDHRFLKPTILSGSGIENTSVYTDETFGPVLAVTTFSSVADAVKKANKSRYGLLASVITKNIPLGEEIARQIEAGSVLINEVAYTAAAPETPWGGMKDTGFGKKHSDEGLLEFVHSRHIHKPRTNLFVFKSLWWFPYTAIQHETFRWFLALYRRSWIEKFKALPIFLSNAIRQIKTDKRI